MIRTQIQLREAQVAYLKRAAAEQDVSMAEVIRKGIDRLMASGSTVSREEIRRRAKAAAGKVRSGIKDLAARHDEIFAEAARS
jgi:hypothetical protein